MNRILEIYENVNFVGKRLTLFGPNARFDLLLQSSHQGAQK